MKLRANAKINLTLDICGKRADGYHLLDSVMQSVSLCDYLTVERADEISVRCSDGLLCNEGNIAFFAAEAFFGATGISGGADIFIEKHIPKAAGMGGGSADAAAVLVALNEIYQTHLPQNELCKIGLSVGADVPFCIVGGTKRVEGIGELLSDAPQLPECTLVLVREGDKLSTAQMYKELDSKPILPPKTADMLTALKSGSIVDVAKDLGNAFLSVCDIDSVKNEFLRTSPLGVCLSGSGPTVFGIYENSNTAEAAAELLKECGFKPFVAVPQSSGVIIE